MIFSNAAVLVLGALQPALGKPTLLHRAGDGSQNEIMSQYMSATETVIQFFAPNPGCGNSKPWVAVWPVDACNPYTADFKAWKYVEPTSGLRMSTVTFNNAQLGVGEYKAAFVCEDGKRTPWMVSKTFQVDAAPSESEGQCVHRKSMSNPEWMYTACDQVSGTLCGDCHFLADCVACDDCNAQCKKN